MALALCGHGGAVDAARWPRSRCGAAAAARGVAVWIVTFEVAVIVVAPVAKLAASVEDAAFC
eukprot:366033-Chlamydomonas_euryale.AAC.5